MTGFEGNRRALIGVFVAVCFVQIASSQQDGAYHDLSWPVTLTYHETKTNANLGESLLKRMYARIGFTDNIIRAEIDSLFDRVKELIEKRLKKCERKRRRATGAKNQNQDMYSHHNSTYSRRNRMYGSSH